LYDLETFIQILAKHDEPRLTSHEGAVVRLIGKGQTSRQIARELGCSASTVNVLVCELMMRIGVGTRSRLFAACHDLGLIDQSGDKQAVVSSLEGTIATSSPSPRS
jgi:DNA-binding NarL/FixJ family response regulator